MPISLNSTPPAACGPRTAAQGAPPSGTKAQSLSLQTDSWILLSCHYFLGSPSPRQATLESWLQPHLQVTFGHVTCSSLRNYCPQPRCGLRDLLKPSLWTFLPPSTLPSSLTKWLAPSYPTMPTLLCVSTSGFFPLLVFRDPAPFPWRSQHSRKSSTSCPAWVVDLCLPVCVPVQTVRILKAGTPICSPSHCSASRNAWHIVGILIGFNVIQLW